MSIFTTVEDKRAIGMLQAVQQQCQIVQIIMISLDPLRSKKIFIRKKLGHTAVSAIKASSVTLWSWQKEPKGNTVN